MRDGEEKSRELAKTLRRQLTSAETILWSRLRRNQIPGRRFRRQHPIGPYVADFACVEARIAVEVDGGTHATDAEVEHDRRRTAYLERQGWKIVRVQNDDVYKRLDGVLDFICHVVPPQAK